MDLHNRLRIYNKIKYEISTKWPTCLVGLFFVVAGFLAGIYTANSFDTGTKTVILRHLMGLGEGSTFLGRLIKLQWYRFISCFIIGLFSLGPFLVPLSVLALTLAAALWSVGWGCVFSLLSQLKIFACLPLFFILVLLHCMTFLHFFYKMGEYLKRTIQERRIPKSSRDILYESALHIRSCYKWFMFSAIASLIEAAVLPLFYS